MEHEVDKSWSKFVRYCLAIAIGMILVSVAFTVLGFALIGSLRAESDNPLCDYFESLVKEPNVQVAEWVGYPQGWKGYPQTWDYETYTDLANGSGILTRARGKERWLWAFRSLEEDNGNHDFCSDVLIVSDAP